MAVACLANVAGLQARLAMEQGHFAEAEKCYRALLYPTHKSRATAAGTALSAQLDDAYFLTGLDGEDEGGAGQVGRGAHGLRQRMEEEFVYVLLCVGEDDQALEVCEQLLARNSDNVTALKYKADALLCLERAAQVIGALCLFSSAHVLHKLRRHDHRPACVAPLSV